MYKDSNKKDCFYWANNINGLFNNGVSYCLKETQNRKINAES